jgi:hypothetical protein
MALLQLLKLRLLHMQLETCVSEEFSHPASRSQHVSVPALFPETHSPANRRGSKMACTGADPQ